MLPYCQCKRLFIFVKYRTFNKNEAHHNKFQDNEESYNQGGGGIQTHDLDFNTIKALRVSVHASIAICVSEGGKKVNKNPPLRILSLL